MEHALLINDHYALIFGMHWTMVDPLQSKHEQVAKLLANGDKFKASFKQNGEENLGTVSDLGQLPKNVKALSGAGQIATMPEFAGKNLLVMLEEQSHNGNPGLVAVVGLMNGNVVLDALCSTAEATKARASYHDRCQQAKLEYATYGIARTISPVEYPLGWEDFLPKKLSRFKSTPSVEISVLRASLIGGKHAQPAVAAILILAIGYFGWDFYQEKEAKRKAELAAQAVNPEVLYAQSSEIYLNEPRFLAKDAFPVIRKTLGSVPSKFAGWTLQKIVCGTESCLLAWNRQTGTFEQFKKTAPENWTDMEFSDDGKALHHKIALSLTPQKLPPKSSWDELKYFKLKEGSKWQILSDLDLHAVLGPVKLQALPPGVSEGVLKNSPHAIRSAAWEIRDGSSWYLAEEFEKTPDFLTYESLSLTPVDGDVKFGANGNVYIKQ